MTPREFCTKYGIDLADAAELDEVIRDAGLATQVDLAGITTITKKNEMQCLFAWRKHQSAREAVRKKREEEEHFLKEEEMRIAEIVRTMPITSTNGFEGYCITEYGGYVSGDEAVVLSDTWLTHGDFNKDRVNDKIKQIRAVAIDELKTAAAQMGCNAVVGLDFDYLTIDRQRAGLGDVLYNNTFIILTANGTAVTIEPIS